MVRKWVCAALLAATSSAAGATWRTATSTNFIVYTEGSETSARALAERLEKYENVLRVISGAKTTPNTTPIRVFMVPSQTAVQDTMPFPSSGVAGYYDDDIRGSYTVMPRAGIEGDDGSFAQVVLFQELAHQFMFHNFSGAYPTWYIEGFADYYGTTKIGAKDVTTVGIPLENRYKSLNDNAWIPISQVLSARRYSDVTNVYLLYAEGWLLVHYLSTTQKRPGQLTAYLKAINDGSSFEAAATKAFGNVSALDAELRDYAAVRNHQVLDLPFKKLDPGPVTVQTLSPAQSALVPFQIRLSAGVPAANFADFEQRLGSVVASYPDDPSALAVLSDAQMLAQHHDAARATVTHWLKVAPQDPRALMFQGMLDVEGLRVAKVTDPARWTAARQSILAANRLAPHTPRILKAYYESFTAQGVLPPAGAQNGLLAAFDTMPENAELRRMVASDFEARDMLDDAFDTIRPLAFRTRASGEQSAKDKARDDKMSVKYRLAGAGAKEETAREMLERLEKRRAGGAKAAKPAES